MEGLHFNDISVGKPFEVPYTEIITVMVLPDSPRIYHGNNLCIRTKESTYLCYAIDRAEAAVQSINERRQYFEEQVNHVPAVMPGAETDEPVNGYCAFCGTALPAEAAFCPKCGKNAHSTMQRNDRS